MVSDPLWINESGGAPTYTANELRQAMALDGMYDGRLLGARQGVRPGGDQLKVSLVSTTITVKTGTARIDPALTTPQGPYKVALPADETHTLTAADATNPRKDIVILRVYDHDEDSSGNRFARSEYLVGTPAGSPAEPAVPAGAIKLALIDVPQSGGGSPVVTDRRKCTVSAGGILPVADVTDRDAISPHDGLTIYRQDRDWTEQYNGAAWRVPGLPVVSSVGDLAAITAPHTGACALNTADGQIYRYTGSGWAANRLYARKTADESVTSSATLQDDDHLFFAVEANATYWIEVFLIHSVAGSVVDLKVAMTYPANAKMYDGGMGPEVALPNAVSISSGEWSANLVDTTSPSASRIYGSSSIPVTTRLSVILVTGATAGTWRLQFAQGASNGTAVVMREGSSALGLRVG